MNQPPTGYFGKTYCVEFTVRGDLDGTTVQPPLLETPVLDNPGGPQNFFELEVDGDLGLIDPDYIVPPEVDERRGTRGIRLVTFIWIRGSNAGDPGAAVDVVDAVDEPPVVQKNVGAFAGDPTFYAQGIFVPQGSMIRVQGMSGSAADPIRVRLHIQFIDSTSDLIEITKNILGLRVEDEGALVKAVTQIMNFTGDGVTASSAGPNAVEVNIPGSPSIVSQDFDDDTTIEIPVAADTDGYAAVELNLSNTDGDSSSFRLDIAISPTGQDASILQVDSDSAITTVAVSVVRVGAEIRVRLTGSGGGTATNASLRIVDTIPRALP